MSELADFSAKMREAEAEAGVPSDEETYRQLFEGNAPEEQAEEKRPRDEKGRFVSNQDPGDEAETEPEESPEATEEETPEEEPEVEPEPEPEETPLLAGKYKDVGELERAYEEAQKTIGSLRNDQGELRRELEQQIQQIQQQVWQQQQQQYQPDPGSIEEMLDNDPRQVVALGLQQQNGALFERGMRAWYEIDPYGAGQYQTQFAQQQLQQQIQQQVQPQIQSATEMAQRQELESALDSVAAQHEDFAEVIGTLTDDRLADIIQSGFPQEVVQGLNGDMASKQKVFETLYRWVKADQAGAVAKVAADAAARQSEESRRNKQQATVASANTTTPAAEPESEEERLAAAFKRGESRQLRAGWEGKETRQRWN